ncbi:protein of unknown function [Xenorhabdus nematophila AN6/1]|nr:hypothetical protein XNA1_3180011 [Xenorhabdus nematophila str. Anatoliense]CEF29906.1 hypothetical protein XNW1_210011 [Xenorhabdus nematophila str. Websteri]CEK21622.1 protein of unknown function [Xenorhabdus nematophila AN6/1]
MLIFVPDKSENMFNKTLSCMPYDFSHIEIVRIPLSDSIDQRSF